MAVLRYVATLSGGAAPFSAGITDLTIAEVGDGIQLYATSRVGGGLSAYNITQNGAANLISQEGFGGGVSHLSTPKISVLGAEGEQFILPSGLIQGYQAAHQLNGDGQIGARMVFSTQSPPPADLLVLMQVSAVGASYVIATAAGQTAPRVYQLGTDQSLQMVDQVGGQGAEMTDLATITLGGTTFVLGVSPMGNQICSYRVNGAGQITQVAVLDSRESGVGFDTPTAVVTAVVAGVGYAILGSSGSGSLTVLRIQSDGQMIPVEHVVDGLDTRFQNVSALETFSLGDRVFVLAGGSDDGVTLLTLMPDGRLLHLQTLADTDATTLQNVTAISATEVGGQAQVFVTSEVETGITQFTLDLGSVGTTQTGGAGQMSGTGAADLLTAGAATTQINAGGGDDILVAAANAVTDLRMQGGAGADIFVAAHNGRSMRIDDFQVGVDSLDLSMIPMLRSLQQLGITSTNQGARLTFGETEIDIRTQDRNPIAQSAFTQAELLSLTRYAPPSAPEQISGSAGADRLDLGGPGGSAMGLEGNDTITSSWGDATIGGGGGNDWIVAGSGTNRIWGGTGSDTVHGGDAGDEIWGGGTAVNQLFGHGGNDTITGADGNDQIAGGSGNDAVYGGVGNDAIYLGLGNDFAGGGAGNDYIVGGAGTNLIYTGTGTDEVQGGTGRDIVVGGGGANRIFGNDGNDWMRAGGAGDLLAGGSGNDAVYGGAGNDAIYLGLGNDFTGGGAGNDLIVAGAGANTIYGGAGNDRVQAGTGRDVISGGAGADVFVFNFAAQAGIGAGRDLITDFTQGVDKIDLSMMNLYFDASGTGTGAHIFTVPGFVVGDVNGDGVGDFAIQVWNGTVLEEDDFIL